MALSSSDKARLYHELGTLLKSGFHMDRGLTLLLGQNPSAARRRWLEGFQRGLNEKLGVAESLEKYCRESTTELEHGLIAAGERGGRLEESCQHLAEYFELRQASVSKALGALIYPVLVAHLAVLLPDISQVVKTGSVASGFAGVPLRLAVLWCILGVIAFAGNAVLRAARTSAGADRCLQMLPLVGKVRGHWALARFCQVMRTSLLAALRMSDSLRLAGGATQSALFRAGSEKAAQSIEGGGDFASSIRVAHAFPVSFENAMETAEHAGALDEEFSRWAVAETQLAAAAQDRAAEWLPRIFYLAVVLYVATRVIGVMGGYYGSLSHFGD